MAKYLKAELEILLSANADYSDEDWVTNWADYTPTPDEAFQMEIQADVGSAVTVYTSHLSTVTLVALKNTDSTNFVTATFRTAGNGATDNIIRIPAGGLLVVSDFTAANNLTLQADTAVVNCKVLVCGT